MAEHESVGSKQRAGRWRASRSRDRPSGTRVAVVGYASLAEARGVTDRRCTIVADVSPQTICRSGPERHVGYGKPIRPAELAHSVSDTPRMQRPTADVVSLHVWQ